MLFLCYVKLHPLHYITEVRWMNMCPFLKVCSSGEITEAHLPWLGLEPKASRPAVRTLRAVMPCFPGESYVEFLFG